MRYNFFMLDKKELDKKELEKAIIKNPADSASLYQLGKIALQAKEYSKAEHLMEQAVGFMPEKPDYLVGLGQAVLVNLKARPQGDRLEKAELLFARAAHIDPKNIGAKYGVAFVAAEQQQWVKAEATSQELIHIAPKDAAGHRLYIGLLDRNDRKDKEKAEYERYLALVPSDAESTLHYIKFLGSNTPPKNSKPEEIVSWRATILERTLALLESNIVASGEKSLSLYTDVETLYSQLTTVQATRRHDFMKRLETRFPHQKNILAFLGGLAKHDMSVKHAEAQDKAIYYYRLALRQDSQDRNLWFSLAEQYELKGDKKQAVLAYKEVTKRNNSDSMGKSAMEALKILKSSKP